MAWLGINKDTYARTTSQGSYKWKYDVDYVGYKYNGNAIMAAIALVQLNYLDEENARRREICKMYTEGFRNNDKIDIIGAPYADECSYHIYELVVPRSASTAFGISHSRYYGGVHYRDNTEYSMYRYAQGTCPHAHEISQHLITLPLHMWLTDEEVEKIIKVVNEFLNKLLSGLFLKSYLVQMNECICKLAVLYRFTWGVYHEYKYSCDAPPACY